MAEDSGLMREGNLPAPEAQETQGRQNPRRSRKTRSWLLDAQDLRGLTRAREAADPYGLLAALTAGSSSEPQAAGAHIYSPGRKEILPAKDPKPNKPIF